MSLSDKLKNYSFKSKASLVKGLQAWIYVLAAFHIYPVLRLRNFEFPKNGCGEWLVNCQELFPIHSIWSYLLLTPLLMSCILLKKSLESKIKIINKEVDKYTNLRLKTKDEIIVENLPDKESIGREFESNLNEPAKSIDISPLIKKFNKLFEPRFFATYGTHHSVLKKKDYVFEDYNLKNLTFSYLSMRKFYVTDKSGSKYGYYSGLLFRLPNDTTTNDNTTIQYMWSSYCVLNFKSIFVLTTIALIAFGIMFTPMLQEDSSIVRLYIFMIAIAYGILSLFYVPQWKFVQKVQKEVNQAGENVQTFKNLNQSLKALPAHLELIFVAKYLSFTWYFVSVGIESFDPGDDNDLESRLADDNIPPFEVELIYNELEKNHRH